MKSSQKHLFHEMEAKAEIFLEGSFYQSEDQ